jgi:glyoxylase-like metal-dependent hydrolase (beta-lactamase superfamily II)
MFRKLLKILGAIFIILVVLGGILVAIYYPAARKLFYSSETVRMDSLMTVYLGGGSNTVVFNSDSAVLVIDTKMGKAAKRLYKDVKAIAADKPVIVVNTHSDLDHVGGNPLFSDARIISGKVDEDYWIDNNGKEGMPSEWITDTLDLILGNETATLINMGQAHTWCDIVVFFRNRGVLVTGDLVFNGINTFLSKGKGSNGLKSIEALKRLSGMPGIEKVIPGHGAIGGRELVDQMQSYFEDMYDAAQHPEKEKEIRKKYGHLVAMPGISSPGIVIDYFRKYP